jgi:protein-S-isoprenylcysteine O-methyltransferase Ste14
LIVSYGVASYVIFLGTVVYAVGFLGNQVVPKSIDSGVPGSVTLALVVNTLLVGAFAVQHSVMARTGFKTWWTRTVPPAIERSTYVLFSSALLIVLFWQWLPMTGTVWDLTGGPAGSALTAVSWLGWAVVVMSTFLINHFELFGLQQVYMAFRERPLPSQGFVTPFLYQLVRHPMMLGFLLSFWATPSMTTGHLLFSVAMSGYMLVGVSLEERDLRAALGAQYEDYCRRVPMLIPFLKRPSSDEAKAPGAL